MSAMTVLDIALAKGAKEINGSINMSEFDQLGLPFFSGCQCCHESLGPYNAYPSRSGYIRCRSCLDDLGFDTVKDYDEWMENYDKYEYL
jgi:hypothetical protein